MVHLMNIVIFNPYKKLHLIKLILFYHTLNGSFSKRFLFKRFINEKYYIKICDIINNVKTWKYKIGKRRIFKIIEIETINRCNNICSFCPVNKDNDIRKYQRMSNRVYEKLIDELSSINYSGIIYCYFIQSRPLKFKQQIGV